MRAFTLAAAELAALLLIGCSRDAGPVRQADDGHDHAAETAGAAPTNRVAIPSAVRQNLGITFAKAEYRAVASTLRVPGRFELLPSGQREYRAMIPGRVELLVEQYEAVEAGTPLYRLHSPRWRELQRELAEARGAMTIAQASIDAAGPLREAHAAHERSLREKIRVWEDRLAQLRRLREAGGGRADDFTEANASLNEALAALADVQEKSAELEAGRIEAAARLAAARDRMELLLATAAALTGVPVERLAAPAEGGGAEQPLWRELAVLEVRAEAPGVVQTIGVTGGAWADESALVVSTIQPERVRFRARGYQSDLGRLRPGLAAAIVPPTGGSLAGALPMRGRLAMAPQADADERTLDLLVVPEGVHEWARPGVSGFLEITLEGGKEELAVPAAAVVRDGLAPVIFRRDPKDPDAAIRMEADLGIDDGRWVVVRSGLREGDEVVLDGVYQLMLATSGSARAGGHFHPDGTFHEGDDH